MKEKRARNAKLIKYRQDHPEMTVTAIARVFHMNPIRARQIIRREMDKKQHPAA